MKKDKKWLKEEINKEVENIDYPLRYSTNEYNVKMSMIEFFKGKVDQLDEPEVPVIPQFVADYLSNVDVYSFEERIEILVNSHSGDSYYFHEMLPKDGHISYELGDKLYVYSQNENLKKLFQLISGYAIEKEPKWIVKVDKGRFVDNFIKSTTGVEVDLSHRLGCTAPIIFKDKSKAEAVALLVGGEVVEETND